MIEENIEIENLLNFKDRSKVEKTEPVEIFKNRQKNLRHLISKVNHLDGTGESRSHSEDSQSDSFSDEVKVENEIEEENGEGVDED